MSTPPTMYPTLKTSPPFHMGGGAHPQSLFLPLQLHGAEVPVKEAYSKEKLASGCQLNSSPFPRASCSAAVMTAENSRYGQTCPNEGLAG